jgi:hypothetical protein
VIGQLVLKRIFQTALVSMDSNIYENWLVIVQKIQILINFEKWKNQEINQKKSVVGLPFLIQNLNFE